MSTKWALHSTTAQRPQNISLDRALPVKAACQGCRSRHLKCDAKPPRCSRCRKENRECDYARSRRGLIVAHLHHRNEQESGTNRSTPDDSPEDFDMAIDSLGSAPNQSLGRDDFLQSLSLPNFDTSIASLGHSGTPSSYDFENMATDPLRPFNYISQISEELTGSDHLHISIFYSSFWPSHPFLPPYRHFQDHVRDSNGTKLRSIITHIGSLYACAEHNHLPGLTPPQPPHQFPRNGFTVQAYLLFAISSHMANEAMRAQEFLTLATDIALDIGLHRREFAVLHGKGVQTIEESWRRTWWELYTIDIMFAALDQKTNSRLWSVDSNVLLPCDELVYREQDMLPPPNTLTDFDRRFFADEDIDFSSFCYRVAAVRTLGRIISITNGKIVPKMSLHREVELLLENLALHLPKQMQTILGVNGEIDEMLFQTHMILHAGTIYLHRPQSALATSTPSHTIACAPRATKTQPYPIAHHTKKIMDAADEICQMVAISSPLLSRTPFFTCALALQALVHLGASGLPQRDHNKSLLKQQIQMSIGALKRLGEVWEIANVILSQVKDVARAVLDIPRDSSIQHGKANDAATQLRLEQSGFADGPSFDLEALTQGNDDDFWMESFLNQTTMD